MGLLGLLCGPPSGLDGRLDERLDGRLEGRRASPMADGLRVSPSTDAIEPRGDAAPVLGVEGSLDASSNDILFPSSTETEGLDGRLDGRLEGNPLTTKSAGRDTLDCLVDMNSGPCSIISSCEEPIPSTSFLEERNAGFSAVNMEFLECLDKALEMRTLADFSSSSWG